MLSHLLHIAVKHWYQIGSCSSRFRLDWLSPDRVPINVTFLFHAELTSRLLPVPPFHAFCPQTVRISSPSVATWARSSQSYTFFSRRSRGICVFLPRRRRSLRFQCSPADTGCPTSEQDRPGLCLLKPPAPENG